MIYPGDYNLSLQREHIGPNDRLIMARVALNALIDPELYPVDITEIQNAGYEARILIHAFLDFMANHPERYGSGTDFECDDFLCLLDPNRKSIFPDISPAGSLALKSLKG